MILASNCAQLAQLDTIQSNIPFSYPQHHTSPVNEPCSYLLAMIERLSLEDGASTLTDFTARILGSSLSSIFPNKDDYPLKILLCGGGRKNKELIKRIKENIKKKIVLINIDDYGVDGDYIESQAFAFLSIRTIMKLPISFPSTTGCKKSSTGGNIVKNF